MDAERRQRRYELLPPVARGISPKPLIVDNAIIRVDTSRMRLLQVLGYRVEVLRSDGNGERCGAIRNLIVC